VPTAAGLLLLVSAQAAVAAAPPVQPREQVAKPAPAGFVTALDDDCTHAGRLPDGGYQFVASCAATAPSLDGGLAVVQAAGERGDVTLRDGKGGLVDELPALSDDMPFTVYWSPAGRWFFANHYTGSGQDRLRLFEVVNGMAIERSDVFADAVRALVERYPCLARASHIDASGWRWSRDGTRLLLIAYARPDACSPDPGERGPRGDWQPMWMIGDIRTGRVDRSSARVRRHVAPPPKDGAYGIF
jgi:hypothetical protein